MEYSIDVNCDLGESYFDEKVGNDAAIIPFVSSCNIACGLHGGDPLTIQNTIELALKNDVNIGAHPSFPDLQNFGRKFMSLSEEELKACLRFQIGAVSKMTELTGGKLRHVKPHGALYNAASLDFELSKMIIDVIAEFDENLVLLGMAKSEMEKAAISSGIPFVAEVFADRNYTDKGSLVSRSFSNAVIKDKEHVAKRCLKMVKEGIVISENQQNIAIQGKSICVHGDTSNALEFVKSIHTSFENNNVTIERF